MQDFLWLIVLQMDPLANSLAKLSYQKCTLQCNQNDALERFNVRIVCVGQSKGEVCATGVARKAYSHQRTDNVTPVSTVVGQLTI